MTARPQRVDMDFLTVTKILNLPDATNLTDPVTLQQMLAQFGNLSWKDDAVVGMTSNVTISSPGATLDGITMTSGMRVLLMGQTSQPENGIYQWNGAAVAMTRTTDADVFSELASAIVAVSQGTNAGTQWRQTQVGGTIGTNNLAFTSFQASAPSATEGTAGIAAIATQTETNTGTNDSKMVTPLKLATYSGLVKKKTFSSLGDGSATSITLTHNLASTDVSCTVYDASTGIEIECLKTHTSTNVVTIAFSSAPTTNQYKAAIFG